LLVGIGILWDCLLHGLGLLLMWLWSVAITERFFPEAEASPMILESQVRQNILLGLHEQFVDSASHLTVPGWENLTVLLKSQNTVIEHNKSTAESQQREGVDVTLCRSPFAIWKS